MRFWASSRQAGDKYSAQISARALTPRNCSSCQSAGATCKLLLMPELPDIAAYITALEPRIIGQPLERVRLASAFLLRTVQPPFASVEGRMVRELRRSASASQ